MGLAFTLNANAGILGYSSPEEVETELEEATNLQIQDAHKDKFDSKTYEYRLNKKRDWLTGRTYFDIIDGLNALPRIGFYSDYFDSASKETKKILSGIFAIESGVTHDAVSGSSYDCRGISQFCAPTAADIMTPCHYDVSSHGSCVVCEDYQCIEDYCWCVGVDNRTSPEVEIPATLVMLDKKIKYMQKNCPVEDEIEMKKLAITAFNAGEGYVCRLINSIGDDATLKEIVQKTNVEEIQRYAHSVIYAALEMDLDFD